VTGSFVLSQGVYAPGSALTTVTGLMQVSGGRYVAGASNHTFNGGLTLSAGLFDGSSAAALDINGVYFQNAGIFTAPSSGGFTVSDDFLVTDGTFNHNSGTVTLDTTTTATVDAPVAGLTFWDFEIVTPGKTVRFTSGDTFTIDSPSTWTVTGASGNNVVLTSTGAGAWNVDPAGSDISFATLTNANNTSGSNITVTNSADGGGNTGFCFGACASGGSGGSGETGGGNIENGTNPGLIGGNPGGEGNNPGPGEGSGSGGGPENNPGGGNGPGGSGGPGGNGGGTIQAYFNNPESTRTKVLVYEGSVYVVDKNRRVKILKKDQSANFERTGSTDDFSGDFYANFRTPEKFKTTVKGGAYTVYLNSENKHALYFVTEQTGPVIFYHGSQPEKKTTQA
jgi:hypothetical protein